MGKIFALLAGINAYPNVNKLSGCLNDIANVRDYLRESAPDADVEVLTDADATSANIARQFRDFLGRAGPDDVAYFHYAGHGTQNLSAPEFAEYFPSRDDEALVCWDYNWAPAEGLLADKELAVLIEAVAARGPHVAVTLDCCHSGSGTRDAAVPTGAALVRMIDASASAAKRTLDSYADGYYAKRLAAGERLTIPRGRHVLLAACDRVQTAKEDTASHRGVFTTALVEVLRQTGGAISYADLLARCRATARTYVADRKLSAQDPQFAPTADFDAGAGFLGRALGSNRPAYYVTRGSGGWMAECGAAHGLPTDLTRPVTFALFGEGARETRIGNAEATSVGAQTTALHLDFTPDPAARYFAELTSLPATPLLIGFTGDAPVRTALEQALAADPLAGAALGGVADADEYSLAATGGALTLTRGGRTIFAARTDSEGWEPGVVQALAHIARYERLLKLDNPRSELGRGAAALVVELDGSDAVTADDRVTAQFAGAKIAVRFKVRNAADQELFATLLWFAPAPDYRIVLVANEQVPKDSIVTLVLDQEWKLGLGADEQGSVDRLKLIVTTEKFDDFLLRQGKLPLPGEQHRGLAPEPVRMVSNDWFVRDLALEVVRTGG